jgi:methionine sulfoxide reductase heme-binding subunit
VRGPRLLLVLVAAIAALVLAIVVPSPDGLAETSARLIRWTARSSLVLFALAFAARPAHQLFKTPLTKYLLAERKWIGLGFAASHAAHLGGIIAFASPDLGGFVRDQSGATAFAALTFVVLFAMAFTSIESVKRAMSPQAWKRLHRTGMYMSWLAFTSTYAGRIAVAPAAIAPTVALLALATIRTIAWLRTRRR